MISHGKKSSRKGKKTATSSAVNKGVAQTHLSYGQNPRRGARRRSKRFLVEKEEGSARK